MDEVEKLVQQFGHADSKTTKRLKNRLDELIGSLDVTRLIGFLRYHHHAIVKEIMICELTKRGKAVVPQLIRMLRDEDKGIRIGAARVLGNLRDRRAFSPLRNALRDNDWEVRQSATVALGESRDPHSADAIIERLSDESIFVQFSAIIALEKTGDPRTVPILIEIAKSQRIDNTREYAIMALGETKDPRAVPVIIESLSGSEFGLAGYAIRALENLTDGDLKKILFYFREYMEESGDVGSEERDRIRKMLVKKYLIIANSVSEKKNQQMKDILSKGTVPKPPKKPGMYRTRRAAV